MSDKPLKPESLDLESIEFGGGTQHDDTILRKLENIPRRPIIHNDYMRRLKLGPVTG